MPLNPKPESSGPQNPCAQTFFDQVFAKIQNLESEKKELEFKIRDALTELAQLKVKQKVDQKKAIYESVEAFWNSKNNSSKTSKERFSQQNAEEIVFTTLNWVKTIELLQD